ncbi:MAG: acetyl-CoA C-acyltransferase [Bdellovibrionales bacterium]|nr:acetyl-CoA C-acyltransferase [Bdellovibrionales bacterium]
MSRVAIVGGYRTPFCKAFTSLSSCSALDMGIHVLENTIKRLNLDESRIDELQFGSVLLDPRTPNLAREMVLRSSCSQSLSAHFVSNNCISGLVAANAVSDGIRSGRISCGLAGGAESMSLPTLTFQRKGEKFFLQLSKARSVGEKLKLLSSFRPQFLFPVPPSPKEPSTGLTMGQHCEITAKEFQIGRETQDLWAVRSHQHAARAQSSGVLGEEIVEIQGVSKDNFVRSDTTVEKLGKLSPVFDRSGSGTLTAGNSSGLTDGASLVCLMSEERCESEGREPLAFIEAIEFAAIDPNDGLLMAPALALPRLLHRTKVAVSDIDLFEIHEAFSAQVIANRVAWEQGWKKYPNVAGIGHIPDEKINVNGGSLAIGHPFAATGGRLLISAARELKRRNASRAVISVCAAGAMAAAVMLTREGC